MIGSVTPFALPSGFNPFLAGERLKEIGDRLHSIVAASSADKAQAAWESFFCPRTETGDWCDQQINLIWQDQTQFVREATRAGIPWEKANATFDAVLKAARELRRMPTELILWWTPSGREAIIRDCLPREWRDQDVWQIAYERNHPILERAIELTFPAVNTLDDLGRHIWDFHRSATTSTGATPNPMPDAAPAATKQSEGGAATIPDFIVKAKREEAERQLREKAIDDRLSRLNELDAARKPLNDALYRLFESRPWPWSPFDYTAQTIDDLAALMMDLRQYLAREPLASNLDKVNRVALRFGDRYPENAVDCAIALLKHVRDDQRAALIAILNQIPGANLWSALVVIRVPMLWDQIFDGVPTPEPETPSPQTCADGPEPSPQKDDANTNPMEKGPQVKGRRGRPVEVDLETDKKIYDAWATKSYKTHEDLANELHLKKRVVKLAIDRERKRRDTEKNESQEE